MSRWKNAAKKDTDNRSIVSGFPFMIRRIGAYDRFENPPFPNAIIGKQSFHRLTIRGNDEVIAAKINISTAKG